MLNIFRRILAPVIFTMMILDAGASIGNGLNFADSFKIGIIPSKNSIYLNPSRIITGEIAAGFQISKNTDMLEIIPEAGYQLPFNILPEVGDFFWLQGPVARVTLKYDYEFDEDFLNYFAVELYYKDLSVKNFLFQGSYFADERTTKMGIKLLMGRTWYNFDFCKILWYFGVGVQFVNEYQHITSIYSYSYTPGSYNFSKQFWLPTLHLGVVVAL
jgi:hypothetical protein